MKRNLNPYVMFERRAASHAPRLSFHTRQPQDFAAWQRELAAALKQTLGTPPARVPPNPQLLAQWEEDDLVKQRWVLDVQPDLAAIVLVFRPAGLDPGEKRPAILACHGHGPHGKNAMMGVVENDSDYGLRMAQAGFVTYSLDWLGFGERASDAKPHYSAAVSINGQVPRDPCNVYYLCATLLGTTVLAMNLHDAAVATDFVCGQPFVDESRLGVMGLSLGGTMASWIAATDERFGAASVIGYNGPFHDIAFREYNVCGSQVVPDLFALCDVADIQGLIAPRPLLMEIGIHDTVFAVDHSLESYRRLEAIYDAAGASDQLQLDLFPGGHRWNGAKSTAFFRQALDAAHKQRASGKAHANDHKTAEQHR